MTYNTELQYSNFGIGTFLGESNKNVDEKLYKILIRSIENGINLIDTAPNYRCERSENIVGKVVKDLGRKGLIICTKVGFLPYSDHIPQNETIFFTDKFIKSKIINKKDIYGDWQSYHPKYIEWQINESLKRLNTDYIDIYYLHNPEEMLDFIDTDIFNIILDKALQFLNKMIECGKIRYIGISSWNGFLNDKRLDLNRILSKSKSLLKADKLKFLQVPYNMAMLDHLTKKTQIDLDKNIKCSLMYLAAKNNIDVITNAPLYHGKLGNIDYPKELKKMVPKSKTIADLALRFSISNPGSNASLVGVTNQSHLNEIISVMNRPLISQKKYSDILSYK
jgi:aryl-alcohol dehydrogenase-like predicted oxidoreductase